MYALGCKYVSVCRCKIRSAAEHWKDVVTLADRVMSWKSGSLRTVQIYLAGARLRQDAFRIQSRIHIFQCQLLGLHAVSCRPSQAVDDKIILFC